MTKTIPSIYIFISLYYIKLNVGDNLGGGGGSAIPESSKTLIYTIIHFCVCIFSTLIHKLTLIWICYLCIGRHRGFGDGTRCKIIPIQDEEGTKAARYACAMAQAVSRRPLTPEVLVLPQVSPCELCVGQNGTGT
jgi:hypothetical protein